MRFPVRPNLLILATLLALPAPPATAKELRLAYAEQMQPLLALDDPRFDRMQGDFRVVAAQRRVACPGASLRLVDGDAVRPLAIAADGRVAMPVDRGLAERGAQIVLQKPDDAPPCQVIANVTGRLPAGREWRYRDLSAFAGQMQAYLETSAGLLSLFAPELRGLRIRFDDDTAQLVIHAAAGDIALRANGGELRLAIDERLVEENPAVSLGAPAAAIDGWLDD